MRKGKGYQGSGHADGRRVLGEESKKPEEPGLNNLEIESVLTSNFARNAQLQGDFDGLNEHLMLYGGLRFDTDFGSGGTKGRMHRAR